VKKLSVVLVSLFLVTQAQAATNEADIRKMLEGWRKAFQAKDTDAVMSFYVRGNELQAYDIVPPLQVIGSDKYRKNYDAFFAMFEGPIECEFRDLRIVADDQVAFIHSLDRIAGTLKDGQKNETWIRATSGLRKIKGKWLIVHDHVSDPVDFETGKGVFDLKP
jgi:ketosteroid isomerase-like protein